MIFHIGYTLQQLFTILILIIKMIIKYREELLIIKQILHIIHQEQVIYLQSLFYFYFIRQFIPNRLNLLEASHSWDTTLQHFYFIGIHLLNKIINKDVNNSNKSLILFSVFCGTLIHYVITRFMMSHAVEFFLCSVLIYIFEKYFNKITTKVLFVLFFTYFLLSMTRPSTFIYSLCLLLVYLPRQKLKKKTLFQILIPSIIFSYFSCFNKPKLYQTYSILIIIKQIFRTKLF